MSDNNNNNRPTFAIYRLTYPGGGATGDLAQALQRALNAHLERHGCPPAGMVVNSTLLGRARKELKTLGLANLQVTTSGGCLAWEVWTELTTGNGHKPINDDGTQDETRSSDGDRRQPSLAAQTEVAHQEGGGDPGKGGVKLFEEVTT